MSYQVLARKWRPQVFEDVVGQAHITRTLQNAIASDRLAHAFLFSGPRGVGKTTTARILAKALNCSEGPTPKPCGVCDSCRETAAGTAVDVIEIDGASNRGIEHIRELRETVKYAPVGGKYKVYVIDEVHMLTNEAFNALLKTLEEPPPHVIFIFATTEPQKIPATIHSRCQRYGFKRIALQELIAQLRRIVDAEKLTVSDQGLAMIARGADGSMRDAQSLLDQAVSYSGTAIPDDDLQTLLGAVAREALSEFAGLLLSRDAAGLIARTDLLLEQGQDLRQFLANLVEHVRNLMVVKIAAAAGPILELPAADLEAAQKQASGADLDQLILIFDSLSQTLDEMRWSPHQRFSFEVGMIKLCSLKPLRPLAEIVDRMQALEGRLGPGALPEKGQPAPIRREPPAGPAASSRQRHTPAAGGTASASFWQQAVAAVREKRPGLASALAGSRCIEQTDTEITVGLAGNSFNLDMVEKRENRGLIEQAVADILNRKLKIKFKPHAGDPAPGTGAPAAQKRKTSEPPDPLVQDALSMFDGTIIQPEGDED